MTNKDAKKVAAAKARSESLTPEQRISIAQTAAQKRWGIKPVKVKDKGNFLDHFGVDVDCYVLQNERKTPVISQRGMGEAIGLSRRGERLKSFVNSKTMEDYIGRDLRTKIDNPIVFQPVKAAAKNEISNRAFGYEAGILIDLCNSILEAHNDGKLSGSRYKRMIQQAQIINGASAKSGIQSLVYALAGYNPTSDEVIAAFKIYVQEEARKYEREFPNELYDQWLKLYQIKAPERGKSWHFKHLTVTHIYTPLAQSNGKLLELVRVLKSTGGKKNDKLFQFLNEIGVRALRMHLGRVLEMAESSRSKEEYEQKIMDRFGEQDSNPQIPLELPAPSDQAITV